MGGLFSCFGRVQLPQIYINIDTAEPVDDGERDIVNAVHQKAIAQSQEIVTRLSNYRDCQALIGPAISNSTPETQGAAWAGVLPNVQFQAEVYDYSSAISEQIVTIVEYALSILEGNSLDVFAMHPALVRSITELFNIILKIDEVKLGLPRLLGDCSFFRRTAPQHLGEAGIDDLYQKSAQITLFYAKSAPFIMSAIELVQQRCPGNQNVPTLFAALVDCCTATLLNEQLTDESIKILLLRCITGATLFYDHLTELGAFHSKVPFAVVDAMTALTQFTPKQTNLVNCIRYHSKHLSEATTMPAIRQLYP